MSADDDATTEYLIEQLQAKDEQIDNLTEEIGELRAEVKALRNGEAEIDRSDMPETNKDLMDMHVTEKELTPSTEDTKRRFVRRAAEWSDGKHLADMTDTDLLSWVNQTDTKEEGKHSYLSSLKKIYDWMETKEWVNENPALKAREMGGFNAESNTKTGLGSDAVNPRLSEAQAGAVVSQIIHPRDRAIFVLGFKNGLRAQSLRMLRRDDVNLETKTIVDKHAKDNGDNPENPATGKKRVVLPIDDETVTVLREWFDVRDPESEWVFPGQYPEDPLCDSQIRRTINDITDDLADRVDGELAAKLNEFTSHKFRKSFVRHMRKSDCDEYILQRLRGDRDKGMNDLYDERDREEIREEYEEHVMKFDREG